ncbi:hypothetical protein FK216_09795 [Moraxellaceae bacterium AER2_44_116]|nr:hypothetical protein [Moraxellaceae bacterium]TQC97179.1 hypothetical protein FK216_09795 [Moraxellaceae bacterium AER2_44_116]
MFIFEFAQQQYVGVDVACSDFLKLPLASIIKDLHHTLCFYYRDMVIYQKESVFFEGLVFPDMALLTSQHINAALEHAAKYTPPTVTPNSQDFIRVLSKYSNKQSYDNAKTWGGTATTHNAILGNQTIHHTDSFYRDRLQPALTFQLLEFVVPYYLVPLNWLKTFAKNKGIQADYSRLDTAQTVSATALTIEKCGRLNNDHNRTTGDTYLQLFDLYKAKVQKLEAQAQTLQNSLNDKETKLQAALATIEQLKVSLPQTTELLSLAASKLIAGMAIDAYGINIHAKRLNGINKIESGLQRASITLSDDTVRKLLTKAAEKIDMPTEHPVYKHK